MRFLHCVHAEFLLAFPRLTRTRLGVSLVALGTTLVWLNAHTFDALTVTLQAGALGSILGAADRKSTRLNSSHGYISYAVFCLKKKKKKEKNINIHISR